MRIRIFKQVALLRHPFVCSRAVLSASIRFGVLLKSVHTNCLPILLCAPDRMARGNSTPLPPSPTPGGFRFHVLDLCWWQDEHACSTSQPSSFMFNGCPADGEPSYLLESHPRKTQTSRSQESASWSWEPLCVW